MAGLHTELLGETRGEGLVHQVVEGYGPWHGEMRSKSTSSLVADRSGVTTAYALVSLEDRGTLFLGPGVEVYEGMIIGESPRPDDINVNPTREKKLTNMRSSTSEITKTLTPPTTLSLEQALEFIRQDECLEVTPAAVRLRKVALTSHARSRLRSRARG